MSDAIERLAIESLRQAAEEITRLRAENAELREWKTAIIDRLVSQWNLKEEHETDPKKAIHDMISWEVMVALDPLVSRDAEALIERGRNELRAQIASWDRAHGIITIDGVTHYKSGTGLPGE